MHHFSLAPSRKLLLATAAAFSMLVCSTPSSAQNDQYAQDDPPAQAGRLSTVSGTVSIQQAGSDEWGQALPNLPLGPGDRIFTDNDGRAEIQVGRSFVRIGPNSDVSFVDDTPWSISFGVAQGSVHIHTSGLWQDQWLHVNSPSGSAGLSQAGDLRVDVMPDQGATVFTDFSDDVLITGAGGFSQTIDYGQALELAGVNPVYPQWLQPADWDDLDKWSRGRDQQIERAASYRYVSPEIPGADELDANGTWQPGTEYGAIWFPNNVSPDWTPYHYGRWVNHDPWGWVWVEDESWGYAPFHYGRWVSYEGRWGWVPGPPAAHPVWSPALVAFAGGFHIGGVNIGISAWFPLGPGEAYRPWYHASPGYIDRINRSNIGESRRVHVQNNYVNIVNVTNVTYVNQTIGVSAMKRDDFAAGRPVRGAAVQVDRHQFDHIQVLDRPEVAPTRQNVIFRPPMRAVPVRAERPVLINEKGKLMAAGPGARSVAVEPPVRVMPPARALPGRTVVAPPPSAVNPSRMPSGPMAPGARPVPGGAQPPNGSDRPMNWGSRQPQAPNSAAPPVRNQGMEPAKPVPPPPSEQPVRPAPPNMNQPVGRPAPPAYTPPVARPVPPPDERPYTPPSQRPVPPQAVQPPAAKPYTPPPSQEARPTPPAAAQPNPRQYTPPPQQQQTRPAPPPEAKPYTPPPPPPQARPTPPPQAQPIQRPAPPPQANQQQERKNNNDHQSDKKDNKKDDKKDDSQPKR